MNKEKEVSVLDIIEDSLQISGEVQELFYRDPLFHQIVNNLKLVSIERPGAENVAIADTLIRICQEFEKIRNDFYKLKEDSSINNTIVAPEPIFTKKHLSLVVDNKKIPE